MLKTSGRSNGNGRIVIDNRLAEIACQLSHLSMQRYSGDPIGRVADKANRKYRHNADKYPPDGFFQLSRLICIFIDTRFYE